MPLLHDQIFLEGLWLCPDVRFQLAKWSTPFGPAHANCQFPCRVLVYFPVAFEGKLACGWKGAKSAKREPIGVLLTDMVKHRNPWHRIQIEPKSSRTAGPHPSLDVHGPTLGAS